MPLNFAPLLRLKSCYVQIVHVQATSICDKACLPRGHESVGGSAVVALASASEVGRRVASQAARSRLGAWEDVEAAPPFCC